MSPKQNKMNTKNRKRRARQKNMRQQSSMGLVNAGDGMRGLTVSRPFTAAFSPEVPGVASLRCTFEAFRGVKTFAINNKGSDSFEIWFPQAYSLLQPFDYFKVTRFRVTTQVLGGAASTFTLAVNVSNNGRNTDLVATNILNDDYAGVANATCPLSLEPPKKYWQETSKRWYNTGFATGIGLDVAQGCMSMMGFGGATDTEVIGWHTVDMEVEFHTLS